MVYMIGLNAALQFGKRWTKVIFRKFINSLGRPSNAPGLYRLSKVSTKNGDQQMQNTLRSIINVFVALTSKKIVPAEKRLDFLLEFRSLPLQSDSCRRNTSVAWLTATLNTKQYIRIMMVKGAKNPIKEIAVR